eukprot:1315470-Amphidinium_carterae.1
MYVAQQQSHPEVHGKGFKHISMLGISVYPSLGLVTKWTQYNMFPKNVAMMQQPKYNSTR